MDWIINLFRYLVFWLDQIIYSFISDVYRLFYDISNADIFSGNGIFEEFSSKIYAILGIFMLFKVSISILTYVVNPDSLMDKTKGFSNIIMKVVTTFAMLILTPLVFTQLRDIQNIVLRENVIGRLFAGNVDSNNYLLDAGDTMAYETLNAFYHFNYSEFPQCEGDPSLWQSPEDAKPPIEDDSIVENDQIENDNVENSNDNVNENSSGHVKTKCNMQYMNLSDPKDYKNLYNNITNGYLLKNVNLFMNHNTLTLQNEDGIYMMDYTPVLSTIAGIAVLLLLLVFCFDIAVRNIKLSFLQILAPIPIISRVDPNKGKDVFSKWTKSCISTYLDLFIRLLAINFAIFIISLVVGSDKGFSQNKFMVNVFIILGALLFAKEIPNLIKELTGFDSKGTFTMNPFSKWRSIPLVGAATTGLASMAGGAYSGYKAGKEAGHIGRGILQGTVGALNENKGKVPLMGADLNAKAPKAFRTGLNSGYKSITGKEYSKHSYLKDFYSKIGKTEIDELKDDRTIIQGRQAELDAELDSLYKELQNHSEGTAEYYNIQNRIKVNRSEYGKYKKNIDAIEDQIADVKRLYTIDESPREDVEKAKAAADRIRRQSNEVGNIPINAPVLDNSTPNLNSNMPNISQDVQDDLDATIPDYASDYINSHKNDDDDDISDYQNYN